MKNILWTIFVLTILSSCSLKEICQERFPPSPYDSIVTVSHVDTLRDTIYQPYQEISFDTASPCPPQVEYHKEFKKGRQTAIVSISKGKLTVTCREDSLRMIITGLKTEIRTTQSKQVVIEKKIELPVKWYWKALAFLNLFWVVVVATLLFIYERGKN